MCLLVCLCFCAFVISRVRLVVCGCDCVRPCLFDVVFVCVSVLVFFCVCALVCLSN